MYNEIVCKEYLLPTRILSPKPQSPTLRTRFSDLLSTVDSGDFVSQMQSIFRADKKYPGGYHYSPYPVDQMLIGGESTQMIPVPQFTFYTQMLMNNIGIPEQVYSGMPSQVASPSLIQFHIFEKTWAAPIANFNDWLTWFAGKLGQLYKFKKATASLVPVQQHGSEQMLAMEAELHAAGALSDDTFFRSLNKNAAYERKKVNEELMTKAEEQTALQEEMDKRGISKEMLRTVSPQEKIMQQQQAQQGAPPAGAPPAGAGGGMPPSIGDAAALGMGVTSINQLAQKAAELASQIITMPSHQRRSTLLQIEGADEMLHAQVVREIEKLENQAAGQGVQMLRQGAM
jgi:hypothetical protein